MRRTIWIEIHQLFRCPEVLWREANLKAVLSKSACGWRPDAWAIGLRRLSCSLTGAVLVAVIWVLLGPAQ